MMRSRRIAAVLLSIGVLIVGSFVARVIVQRVASAVTPVERQDPWWVELHQSFVQRASKGDVDVLFVGDSITRNWAGPNGKDAWDKLFAPLKAVNFGIRSDQTGHVLWRLTEGKELGGIQPKVVVLLIGTNNMADHTARQIADGITAIVGELNAQRPQARVLLLGIFPRGEKATDPFRAKIKDVNQRIAKLDDGKQVRYLDIGDKFLDKDGTISKDIMPDFLHLSKKGYELWADAITPTLQEMLK
jgi:lysophospholipase L1-like esterase